MFLTYDVAQKLEREEKKRCPNPERIYDETGPGITQSSDFVQCVHPVMKKTGFSRNGKQRSICTLCRSHFTANRLIMTSLDEIRMIAPLYRQGKTVEEAVVIAKLLAEEMGFRSLNIIAISSLYLWFQRQYPSYAVVKVKRLPGMLPDRVKIKRVRKMSLKQQYKQVAREYRLQSIAA